MKKKRVPGSCEGPAGSQHTEKEQPGTKVNEAEAQSKTYSTGTAHGWSFPSASDKGQSRTKEQELKHEQCS